MPSGAVFLSYARADRIAAERFAATLDAEGLDVWFDRNEEPQGETYAAKIRQHLQRCDLFIPLLSRASESQADGFFRREWQFAAERQEKLEGSARFILPVNVDPGLDAETMARLPPPFSKGPVGSAPGGEPTPELLRDCILAVRQIRSRRTA
jgi:hypothetical protein